MKVKECMCKEVESINPNTSIKECAKIMSDNHIGCVPVCNEQKKVVGIITDRDLLLRAVACDKDINTTKASDIMTCNVYCCSSDTDVKEAENIMSTEKIRRIPIVDNNKIVGILTLGDISQASDINKNDVCTTLKDICSNQTKNAE